MSFHGYCGDPSWSNPTCVLDTQELARPKYSKIAASEFLDDPDVLLQKVTVLVSMIKNARKTIVYTGAGISTSAGIPDYASKTRLGSLVSAMDVGSRLLVPPTLSHRVVASLEKRGHVHGWLQQNHDGLAQKAGYPLEKLNEIHGSWFDRSNPVVKMDGHLKADLFRRMEHWAAECDLCLSIGTSMCGMTSDCVAKSAADRHKASGGTLAVPGGLVIITLQKTPYDEDAALRIFAKIDDVMGMVAKMMKLEVDKTTYSAYPSTTRNRKSSKAPL